MLSALDLSSCPPPRRKIERTKHPSPFTVPESQPRSKCRASQRLRPLRLDPHDDATRATADFPERRSQLCKWGYPFDSGNHNKLWSNTASFSRPDDRRVSAWLDSHCLLHQAKEELPPAS